MNPSLWHLLAFCLLLPASLPISCKQVDSRAVPDDKAIAAMPAEDKVRLARSLVEQAIKAKNDPEGALKLMVKAGEVAKLAIAERAPNAADLVLQFNAKDVDLSHLFQAMKPTFEEKRTPLSPRVALIERHEIEEVPFRNCFKTPWQVGQGAGHREVRRPGHGTLENEHRFSRSTT